MGGKAIIDDSIGYSLMQRIAAIGNNVPFWLDEICVILNKRDQKHKRSKVKKELESLVFNGFLQRVCGELYVSENKNLSGYYDSVITPIEVMVAAYLRPKGYCVRPYGSEIIRLAGISTQMSVKHVVHTSGPTEILHLGRYGEEAILNNLDHRFFSLDDKLCHLAIGANYLGESLDKKSLSKLKEIWGYPTYSKLFSLEFLTPTTKKLLRKYG